MNHVHVATKHSDYKGLSVIVTRSLYLALKNPSFSTPIFSRGCRLSLTLQLAPLEASSLQPFAWVKTPLYPEVSRMEAIFLAGMVVGILVVLSILYE